MTETDLHRAILKALELRGHWAFRVNAGGMQVGQGKSRAFVRMAPAGTPDICLLSPQGWLEVKTPTGKLSKAQDSWHTKARLHSVRVATVRSVSEALAVVERWEAEDAARCRRGQAQSVSAGAT